MSSIEERLTRLEQSAARQARGEGDAWEKYMAFDAGYDDGGKGEPGDSVVDAVRYADSLRKLAKLTAEREAEPSAGAMKRALALTSLIARAIDAAVAEERDRSDYHRLYVATRAKLDRLVAAVEADGHGWGFPRESVRAALKEAKQ